MRAGASAGCSSIRRLTHIDCGQRIIERGARDICGYPDAWRPGNSRWVECVRESLRQPLLQERGTWSRDRGVVRGAVAPAGTGAAG